jgi:hypothetical protein
VTCGAWTRVPPTATARPIIFATSSGEPTSNFRTPFFRLYSHARPAVQAEGASTIGGMLFAEDREILRFLPATEATLHASRTSEVR